MWIFLQLASDEIQAQVNVLRNQLLDSAVAVPWKSEPGFELGRRSYLGSSLSRNFIIFSTSLSGIPTIEMKGHRYDYHEGLYGDLCHILRKCMFRVLSVGPIPAHIAFIMDGNRRYATRHGLDEGGGHIAGFMNLCHVLRYCYEMGVRYVTVYAFSIDNFNRRPEEVQGLMNLFLESINKLLEVGSVLERCGIRLYFIGNLKLLRENVRAAVENAMRTTADNKKVVLFVCMAYTSCDEILNSVGKSCKEKLDEVQMADDIDIAGFAEGGELPCAVRMADVERNMYMSVAPDPDIVIRTSGETRLTNFLLWQTANSQLHCPKALFPEFGLGDLIWSVLNYQKSYSYLQKQIKKP